MDDARVKTVPLPSGERVPALGLGTWRMGESRAQRAEEIATLRLALDLGITLIDTAEMYGEGRAEALIGEALGTRREEIFLVSKVYPHNASREGAIAACERSLLRLRTDRLDLYLLHWRGQIALEETLEAFVRLQREGKIRYFGVSNFDTPDMQELWDLAPGRAVAVDQVLYNPGRRGIEWSLRPWLNERHVPLMAYSPLEQGELLQSAPLAGYARQLGMSPAQVALAWLLTRDDVIAIPKTASRVRLRENLGALAHPLDADALRELDRLFPAPTESVPLQML